MKLSLGEEFVVSRLAEGDAPKEIAIQRKVTRPAISQISRRIKAKMGARTMYQAVAMYAVKKAAGEGCGD